MSMRFLRNMPIKRKVTMVILLTTATALLLTGGGLFVFQMITFKQNFKLDLIALGKISSTLSEAQIAFKASEKATTTLGALREKSQITDAQLRLENGTLFAHIGDPEWKPQESKGSVVLLERG